MELHLHDSTLILNVDVSNDLEKLWFCHHNLWNISHSNVYVQCPNCSTAQIQLVMNGCVLTIACQTVPLSCSISSSVRRLIHILTHSVDERVAFSPSNADVPSCKKFTGHPHSKCFCAENLCGAWKMTTTLSHLLHTPKSK